MKFNVLNQMRVKALSKGKFADGQGLWLEKKNRLSGKWILRLVVNGNRREMGLGRWPDVSIAEARERAAVARRTLRDGIDPIEKRAKERSSVKKLSFHDAAYGCYEARKAELKGEGKAGRWLSPMTVHILPAIGNLKVEEIDQHILVKVLTPIWHEKSETASKAINRINLTLKHAAALGLDVDLQATMKARALLGKQRRKTSHIPSLPYAETSAFYKWLTVKTVISAFALRFLILTVARTSEIRLATFDEIEDGIWILAGERTKTGQPHRIPLSREALLIVKIARNQTDGNYLFPSPTGKALSDAAMSGFMRREGYAARPHGFRATFRTWVEDKTDTPYEVKESALAHVVGTATERAYQRSDQLDKRRALMDLWAEFVTKYNT